MPTPRTPQSVPARRLDAVIVGGGAAGLSLACHLAAGLWSERTVLVVDDGALRADQRAWAYWSRGHGLLDPFATTSVDRLRIRSAEREVQLRLATFRYRWLTGTDIARAADTYLAVAPGFRRVTGTVRAVTQDGGGARVSLEVPGASVPAEVSAAWVFDSVGIGRPPRDPSAGPRLEFLGHRIETDEDAFDPTTPTLMDFRTGTDAGLAFMYVLPTSRRSALVEHTRFVFSPTGDDARALAAPALVRYVEQELGLARYRVTGVEKGTIALVTAPAPQPSGRVIPIGAPAGMVKASTGYGFERIQRHSVALARSLARHAHPYDLPLPRRRHGLLDAVLLDVARDRPDVAVEAFVRLFARNPADRVLAFLDEDTTLREELALVRTLPQLPFLRALAGGIGRGRSRLGAVSS